MEYFIGFIIISGTAWTSYKIGMRDGGAKMIDMLENIGIIKVDSNDNVTPNKTYNSK